MKGGAAPKHRGTPAHLAAASAVAREHFPAGSLAALLYRTLELCASALLPACLCWVVDPCAMAPLFALLWFLPAAWRAGSLLKPAAYPLLCFIADDVSLLGLHPTPRRALGTYTIGVLRTLLLVAAVPLCSESSPIPPEVTSLVVNRKALALFDRAITSDESVFMAHIWVAGSAAVLLLSLVWAAATVALLLGSALRGHRRDALLEEVDGLAADVERAAKLPPRMCREELQGLQRKRRGLKLASLFNTVGPAWASVLHIAMDIGSVVTMLVHGTWSLAIPLAISVGVSIIYLYRVAFGHHKLIEEVKVSLQRGLVTENYLEAIRSDKGVLRIPETVLKVYGLPFAAKSPLSVVTALGSILGNVALVAKFVFTEFDLGVETVGYEHAGGDQKVK